MQAPPAGVACFKCGKTGHWSRDCTVPPSEWVRKALPPARPRPPEPAETPRLTPTYERQEAAGPSTARYGGTQTPGTAPRTLPKGQGCFKCGKTGHWSRDCTAPPSEQLPRAPFSPGASTGGAAQNDLPSASGPQKPAPLRKPDTKKPRKRKIKFEELKEKDAIAEVFCQFPDRFARQFKGKGHEVSDLRRLLEMYKNWQQKYFPLHGFDEAMHQIADLGRSNRLKVELREMRRGVLKVMEDAEREASDKAAAAAAAEAATGVDGEQAEAGADAMEAEDDPGAAAEWDDDDDDELVALQQQGWEEQAEAAPMEMLVGDLPAPPAAQAEDAQPMDIDGGAGGDADWLGNSSQLSPEDEELLALATAPLSQPEAERAPAPAAGAHAAEPWQEQLQLSPEDEELLALAEAPLSQAEAEQPVPIQPAAQQSQDASQLSPEDEELLALATAPLSQAEPAGAAGTLGGPQAAQGSASQDDEDDELLALAGAPLSQPAQAAVVAPAQPGSSASLLSPEDEELLALAAAPLSLPARLQPDTAAPETGAPQQPGSTSAGMGSQAGRPGVAELRAHTPASQGMESSSHAGPRARAQQDPRGALLPANTPEFVEREPGPAPANESSNNKEEELLLLQGGGAARKGLQGSLAASAEGKENADGEVNMVKGVCQAAKTFQMQPHNKIKLAEPKDESDEDAELLALLC